MAETAPLQPALESEPKRDHHAATPQAELSVESYGGLAGRFFSSAPNEPPPENAAALFPAASGQQSVRAVILKRAQQTHGNQFLQRFVQRKPSAIIPSAIIQRQCACGGTCAKCNAAPEEAASPMPTEPGRVLQAQFANSGEAPEAAASSAEIIPSDSTGTALEMPTRALMESRFGQDFSRVRVHTDASANASAEALNANAFTTGRDIYFAAGKYAPATQEGQHLLAHELTHTVQQSEGATPSSGVQTTGEVLIGAANDPLEHEADRTADAVTSGVSSGTALSGAITPDATSTVRGDLRSTFDQGLQRAGQWTGQLWDQTGGRVARGINQLAEVGVDWVRTWLEGNVPWLMSLLRGDLVELLKERIAAGLDGYVGGLMARIQREGLLGALAGTAEEIIGGLSGAVGNLGSNACNAIAGAAQRFFDLTRWLGGTAFDALRRGASAVGDFLSTTWTQLGQPAWSAIKSFAGETWQWIQTQANRIWQATQPIRAFGARIWNEAKRLLGIAWDTGGDILDWFKEKASAAWNRIKETLQPIMGPLKVIGTTLLLLSPLGPIVAIGAAGYGLWQAVKWLANNWNEINIVVRAQAVLREQILPAIRAGIATVTGLLQAAVTWLGEKARQLTAALAQLADALGANALLRVVRQAVTWLQQKAAELAAWVSSQFQRLVAVVTPGLQKVWAFLQPILVVLLKLAIVSAVPMLWPVYISAVVWMLLPECVKPPIIDFILDLLLGAIRAIPSFRSFGETWAQVKEVLLRGLTEARNSPVERKVELSNRVANMIAGGSLEGYGNLIAAAQEVPQYFVGQVQEELLGMNLGEPLPFERSGEIEAHEAREATANAGLELGAPAEDVLALTRQTHAESDIGVSHVASFDLSPELLENLNLREGEERVFGENSDPANSVAAIQAELATGEEETAEATADATIPNPSDTTTVADETGTIAAPATTTEPATSEAATPPASPMQMTPDEQIAMLMQDDSPMPCTQEQPTGGTARAEQLPAHMRYGPFTAEQRGRYLWHQMKRGISSWYECHKVAVWAGITTAVVLLIVDLFLTGGATFSTLMQVLGYIMIGVAVVRIAGFVAEYIGKAILGDIPGAAKALAHGLAAFAVEAVFALMFNLGALLKRIKGGVQSSMRALERVAPRAAAGIRRVAAPVAKASAAIANRARAARQAVASQARRLGRAIIRRGKIILEGLPPGVGRGVQSLQELAERLWARLRFRRFKIQMAMRRIQLFGYINPWILLANGDLEWVENSQVIRSTVSGKIATARRTTGEVIEGLLVRGTRGKPDYRQIADLFFKEIVSDTNVIHHAIEQQVLKRFPGIFALHEIHGGTNLRTIIRGAFNSEVHLSKIRILWNDFYLALERAGLGRDATRAAFKNYSLYVDRYIDAMKTFMANSENAAKAMSAGDAAVLRELLEKESLRLLSTPAMSPSTAIIAALGKGG